MSLLQPHISLFASLDAQAAGLIETLINLSNQNSGSFNTAGVNAIGASMQTLFAPLGAEARFIELAPYRSTSDRGDLVERPLGRALQLRKRSDAPLRIFLGGHMDTVFAADHPFQRATRIDDDRLNGPGVADLKGGLLTMFLALSALESSPHRERIGWEVLLNPDEEIGSQGSAPLLIDAAERNHLGLIYEPAYADGGLAGTRKGSGNFDVIVRGRAAHAGRNPQDGRNAIALGSEVALLIQALGSQRDGLSVNVGYIHGGGALNIVPDICVVKFNVRTAVHEDQPWLLQRLDQIIHALNTRDGYALEWRGGFTRPPKPASAGIGRLQSLLSACGTDIGIDLRFTPTGGCCDGNNLAAAGLPNVDTLGVVGGEIHSAREWMRLSSLAERAKLSALLLLRLASGELAWN